MEYIFVLRCRSVSPGISVLLILWLPGYCQGGKVGSAALWVCETVELCVCDAAAAAHCSLAMVAM